MHLVLVSRTLDGHRRDYVRFFERWWANRRCTTLSVSNWRETLFVDSPALFLMVEEGFAGYVVAALWRALLGRRTVGLLFRGREAVLGDSSRLRLKRYVLGGLRRVPHVTTLSIVPFAVDRRLATVADDWIDDPQLWDLEDNAPESTPLSEAVHAAAGTRGIVVSLGAQKAAKGFDFFTRAWLEVPELRRQWLFVAAGKVAEPESQAAMLFEAEGGYLVDRFITNAELHSLYRVADVVWGIYAPFYDQASGIFGRAVQYDVPILLRRGSAVETYGRELGVRQAAVDYGVVSQLVPALVAACAISPLPSDRLEAMRTRSASVLNAAVMGKGE